MVTVGTYFDGRSSVSYGRFPYTTNYITDANNKITDVDNYTTKNGETLSATFYGMVTVGTYFDGGRRVWYGSFQDVVYSWVATI